MSVLEFGKLIISIISTTKGIQIAFTLISLIGALCGFICGFLVYYAFILFDKYGVKNND